MADAHLRRSALRDTGSHDDLATRASPTNKNARPKSERFTSQPDTNAFDSEPHSSLGQASSARGTGSKTVLTSRSQSDTPLPTRNTSLMFRLFAPALLLACLGPLLHNTSFFGRGAVPLQGVEGGVIPPDVSHVVDLSRRQDSQTDICFRWAQQSAVVNGTLYLYGGQASTEQGQTQNTWNNDFLTLDLTKTWNIASPSLTGLPQPSGPPAVALGYLFNSLDSLFLYGGEFSWKPAESPTSYSTWEYSISSEEWIEHSNPQTSSGESAPSNNDDVQRSAEGAGANVPSLGRGFYFGGHLDGYTTQGWSQSIPRIYLQSLLEFTFPDQTNDQVDALGDGQQAGSDGNYRNITEGGLQKAAGFTDRADGLLLYVPGFGDQGILLALAGGTNETYTQMNIIDVYDIADSTWYKQSTSGPNPKIRVNPCAVVAAAPDGSSYNIYMFGGQQLLPYGEQTQYDDMWILSVPSFTWIEVDMSKQSVPYGRSGHTCDIWNAQMVMVGGYVGDQLSCEAPGIYLFDLSSLEWVQQYTALSAGSSGSSDSGSDSDSSSSGDDSSASGSQPQDFNSTGANNPLNQQPAQIRNDSNFGGLEGSYGYQVPSAVIDVIGGGPNGGATVTKPVLTATGGPLATGTAVTYTVTNSDGSTATETANSNNGKGNGGNNNSGNNGSSSGSGSSGDSGPNIAAIVAGTVAGLLFLLVCYLLFCLYLYRKQLRLYKNHVEMSQRQARGEKVPAIPGLLPTNDSSAKNSWERPIAPGMVSSHGSSSNGRGGGGIESGSGSNGQTGTSGGDASGYQSVRRSSSSEDLLAGQEPTFVGVLLNPRRSLRVVNKD